MTVHFAGAYAVVRDEVPRVYLAEDIETLERVLAVQVVAQLEPASVSTSGRGGALREALLNERWGDAVGLWMEETGVFVDVYAEPLRIYPRHEQERLTLELQVSPLLTAPSDEA